MCHVSQVWCHEFCVINHLLKFFTVQIVTLDMYLVGGGQPSVKKNSFLALNVWPWRCFEDDIWNLTWDSWHMTENTWHLTHDRLGKVDFLSKCHGLAMKLCWRLHVTCYMWHVTCDTWLVTHHTWHLTHDRLGEVSILSKCQLPSSNGLAVRVFWRWHMTSDTWLMTHDP